MSNADDPATPGFFGIYRGTVANDVDPEATGRVQVDAPSVSTSTLGWAPVVGGQHLAVGDAVFVSFEAGDVNLPVVLGTIGGSADGSVRVQSATTVVVSAPMVHLESPMVTVDGVLKAQTVITESVVSASYSPGAGNIW